MIDLKPFEFSRKPAASNLASLATFKLFKTISALASGLMAAVAGIKVIDSGKF